MLLKDIPGVLPSLANSFLANTELWSRDVSEIIPHQLVAQRWLAIDRGIEHVDTHLEFLVNQANIAAMEGLIPNDTPWLGYKTPQRSGILSSELEAGLAKLPSAMARAAVFGLEMDLPLDKVMSLTYMQAANMELTETARTALRAQVRSIASDLAFWQPNGGSEVHGPLFGFANEVYANFDMSWNALRLSYKGMIPAHFDFSQPCE